jgi:hypothetical protein
VGLTSPCLESSKEKNILEEAKAHYRAISTSPTCVLGYSRGVAATGSYTIKQNRKYVLARDRNGLRTSRPIRSKYGDVPTRATCPADSHNALKMCMRKPLYALYS